MTQEYIFPKTIYKKNDVSFLYLFFENGDYLQIKNAEIINFSFNVYDKLIKSHKGYNPVVESGFLKLKICGKQSFTRTAHFLYDESEFKKDRKAYIENRCTNESTVTEIWLFDSNNWHKVLHCDAMAKMDGEFLMFEFLKRPSMGDFSSKNHCINISNLKKEQVHSIDLDFENCESFVVYNSEIEEINLNFEKQLEWGSGDLYRKINSGYIKIRLKTGFYSRDFDLFDNKRPSISTLEKRLCGDGECTHDICHLYIDFCHAGYGGIDFKECIEIDNIASSDEIENSNNEDYEYREEFMETFGIEWEDNDFLLFEGGYCKKLKDKSIVISFGKNAKETIDKFS